MAERKTARRKSPAERIPVAVLARTVDPAAFAGAAAANGWAATDALTRAEFDRAIRAWLQGGSNE